MRLKLAVPDLPVLRSAIEDERGEWMAQSGAELEIVVQKRSDDTAGGLAAGLQADVVVYEAARTGSMMQRNALVELPQTLFEPDPQAVSDWPVPIREHLIQWDRRPVAFPISTRVNLLIYRADRFAAEAHRTEFQRRFGRELRPPRTWDEFDDLVRYFAEAPDRPGASKPAAVVWNLSDVVLCRAAAYGLHPESLSFYFDVQTLEPLVAGAAFERALSDWDKLKAAVALADAGADPFAMGDAVMAIIPCDMAWVYLAEADHPKGGKLACVALPGATQEFNYFRNRWEDRPADLANQTALVDGWVASVMRSCAKPEAAIDLLQHLARRNRLHLTATDGHRTIGPQRFSQVAEPGAWIAMGWHREAAPSYLAALTSTFQAPQATGVLRIDGAATYRQALDRAIQSAWSGQATPPGALQAAAAEWRAISEKRDRASQLRQYRRSLGQVILE